MNMNISANKKFYSYITSLASFLLLVLSSNTGFAQPQSPCDANPFCSDSTYNFPNLSGGSGSSGQQAIAGPNYGCLFTQPNAIWYYMQIGTAGPMQLTLTQTNNNGIGIDIDFAMWGPYPDLATGCAAVMGGAPSIQCSYSASSTETLGIGMSGGVPASTPPAPQVGDVYIVVMTNYNGSPGSISFNQTGGTGSADCSILYCNLETSNTGPVCAGQPFQVLATNDTAQYYHWTGPNGFSSFNSTATAVINTPGNYTFDVVSYIGTDTCYGSTTVTIYPATYDTTNVEICKGETYNFHGQVLYETGQYNITHTNHFGCDSIITLNLLVNPMPDVSVPNMRDFGICAGSTATFELSNPETNVTYQWRRNGINLAGETGSKIITDRPGTYVVRATTDKGCIADSKPFTLIVNPNPVAEIVTSELEALCAYDTVTLKSVYDPNYIYKWTPEKPFKILTGTETNEVRGVFLEPRTDVELTVVNQYGCVDKDMVTVWTKPCCDVFVPNAFSPNNDGVNDYFFPVLEKGQILTQMKVFDRYGQLVYDNDSPRKGWDGHYQNGTPAKTDTYMFYIHYTCSDRNVYMKKGSVILVR